MSDSSPHRERTLAEALRPFAEACRFIESQYDQLASDHGEVNVRRPTPDALSMTFSYGTLRDALDAFEKWLADAPASSDRIPSRWDDARWETRPTDLDRVSK